jgi:hypothetical protein
MGLVDHQDLPVNWSQACGVNGDQLVGGQQHVELDGRSSDSGGLELKIFLFYQWLFYKKTKKTFTLRERERHLLAKSSYLITLPDCVVFKW